MSFISIFNVSLRVFCSGCGAVEVVVVVVVVEIGAEAEREKGGGEAALSVAEVAEAGFWDVSKSVEGVMVVEVVVAVSMGLEEMSVWLVFWSSVSITSDVCSQAVKETRF
jgi:hypothetical protein